MKSSTGKVEQILPLQSSDTIKRQNGFTDSVCFICVAIILLIISIFLTFIILGGDIISQNFSNNNTDANVSTTMPKVYKLEEVRGGLKHESGNEKITISDERLGAAARIVFEAIKIHSNPNEREWVEMCKRISEEMDKGLGGDGDWSCIVSDKPITSYVKVTDEYIKVKLEDLFFQIFN